MMVPMNEEQDDREGRVVAAIPADTFGHRLMLVRAHLGHMTVKDAAEKAGVNYGSWSKWERGSSPRDLLEVVDAIADGLNIDREWLLRGGQLSRPKPRRLRATSVRRHISPTSPRRPRRISGARIRVAA
jgi:transcriptional regulator with XRE-family HTH domain